MGQPKEHLVLPDGRLMAQAVGETLQAVCREVVIVGPPESPTWAAHTWRCVADRTPGLGPIGGIEALLASGLNSGYLLCPSDIPLLSAELLERLLDAGDGDAAVFHVAGQTRPSPLPLRISASCLGAVETLIEAGGRAVHELLDTLDVQCVEVRAQDARELVNVNTLDEYEAL